MNRDTSFLLTLVVLTALALPGNASARWDTIAAHRDQGQAKATFAGGCFWCMEEAFEALNGVLAATSGYIGGATKNPTYEQVSEGRTGHAEAIEVVYDPSKITYQTLLDAFWRNVDPFDGGGQFCDRGSQYRPAIFYHSEEERRLAEASKEQVSKRFGRPINVQLVAATQFYAAETYHQDYYKKNPVRYKFYKWNCGRAQRLESVWSKPSR